MEQVTPTRWGAWPVSRHSTAHALSNCATPYPTCRRSSAEAYAGQHGRTTCERTGATIGGGATVGENAVVGAGSVVMREVPPDTLVGGNPAQIIRSITE